MTAPNPCKLQHFFALFEPLSRTKTWYLRGFLPSDRDYSTLCAVSVYFLNARCFHMFFAFFHKKQHCLKLDHSVTRMKAGGRRRTEVFTHTGFFTQRSLYTKEFFTYRRFYTEKPLLAVAFADKRLGVSTHRSFYTKKSLHRGFFTHRRVCTRKFLHREAFTQRSFYTQKRLHTASFYTHTEVFTQRSLYTEDFFTHRRFYTEKCLL